jgi:DHA1 family quinolone resistance protein-like MFS transporter
VLRDDPLPVYIINQTVHWFIVGITLPIMVLYMTAKGLDLFQAGMTLSVYSATVILLELPTGGLSDSLGRKKVYLYSLVMSSLSGTVLLFATGLPLFMAGFILYGTARALSSGSMDAWFVDEFALANPGGDLQRALATANVFIPLGIGAGSLIGGVLPMMTTGLTENLDWMSPYSANILLMVVLVIAQILTTSVLVQERAFKGQGSIASGLRSLPTVLSEAMTFGVKDRFTLVMMTSSTLLGFGLLSVELLWQPRAQMLLEDTSQTWVFGVLAAGYFFASSVGNALASRYADALGKNQLRSLTWLRAVSGIILIVISWQTGMLEFALLYLLLYMFFGLATSPHTAVFNARIPRQRRSTLMSFESLMLQGGGLIGTFTIGWLAEAHGITAAWTTTGIVLLFSSITYGYLWLYEKRK